MHGEKGEESTNVDVEAHVEGPVDHHGANDAAGVLGGVVGVVLPLALAMRPSCAWLIRVVTDPRRAI